MGLVAGELMSDLLSGIGEGEERLAPYFDLCCRFTGERGRCWGARGWRCRDYLGWMLAYARLAGWGKRPISRQAAFAVVDESRVAI